MELLEKVEAFKSTANDFSQVNPVLAFYLYKYYMAQVIKFYQQCNDNSQKNQLQPQIKAIEKEMNKMKNNSGGNLSEDKDIKQILEYVELMFAKNDHFYRSGQATQQVAEDFLTLFRLYEVSARFGKLDEGQNKRRLYSKKKYIEIMKQVKAGKLMNSQQSVKKSQIPVEVPPPPQAKLSIQQINKSILQSRFKPELPKPTQTISYDKVTMQIEASKCLQYAVSELSFDRYKFAREQAIRALELLDQLVDQ